VKREICELCLLEKDLQESHLMPRSLYKKIRGSVGRGNNDPTVVTPGRRPKKTSHQYREYVLCRDCEQHFSINGEDYVMRLAQTKGKLPLLDMLEQVATPTATINNLKAYTGAQVPELDRDRLSYFALSVFWRASVHTWEGPDGDEVRIELGSRYNEELRRYLLGKTGLPPLAYLKVNVCSDEVHRHVFFAPCPALKGHNNVFTFMACGIDFVFGIGRGVLKELKNLSILPYPHWITSSDCMEDHKYRISVS
jgi:hypothetical protein